MILSSALFQLTRNIIWPWTYVKWTLETGSHAVWSSSDWNNACKLHLLVQNLSRSRAKEGTICASLSHIFEDSLVIFVRALPHTPCVQVFKKGVAYFISLEHWLFSPNLDAEPKSKIQMVCSYPVATTSRFNFLKSKLSEETFGEILDSCSICRMLSFRY